MTAKDQMTVPVSCVSWSSESYISILKENWNLFRLRWPHPVIWITWITKNPYCFIAIQPCSLIAIIITCSSNQKQICITIKAALCFWGCTDLLCRNLETKSVSSARSWDSWVWTIRPLWLEHTPSCVFYLIGKKKWETLIICLLRCLWRFK